MNHRSVLRVVLLSVGVAACAYALACWRVGGRGREAMAESDRAFHAGQLTESIQYARRAALLYSPGSAHIQHAYERLLAIARGSEAAGDRQVAEMAWAALVAASAETSHGAGTPRPEGKLANQQLARLRGLAGRTSLIDSQGTNAEGQAAVFLPFLLFLVCTSLAIWRGIARSGAMQLRAALLPAGGALLGALLWMVGLWAT